MSFSYDTKNELCRLPVQKLCCARAEAYGILLFCNTFSATEVRIITENPHFAARPPKLFRRSFNRGAGNGLPNEVRHGKIHPDGGHPRGGQRLRSRQATDAGRRSHVIAV